MRGNWSTLKKLIWQRITLGASFIWKLATGTIPLTISDAIAKPIKSLVQYGACDQAATPTPSSPSPIYCNNGELGLVDTELPTYLRRLTGIEFDASAIIVIDGFKLKSSDTVRISFSVDKACNVFGCYTDGNARDNYSLYVSSSAGGKYMRYNGKTYKSYLPSSKYGTRYDVVITPAGITGFYEDDTFEASTFTASADLVIGSTATTTTSSKLDGKIYGNIVVDNRLCLIPCENVVNGDIGYYDTYSGQFYAPLAFSANLVSLGYDDSKRTRWGAIGYDEILNVYNSEAGINDQASVANLLQIGEIEDKQDIITGEITRNCKFIVLSAGQAWSKTGGSITDTVYLSAEESVAKSDLLCSHFKDAGASTSLSNLDYGECKTLTSAGYIYFKHSSATSLQNWKDWLTSQRNAGTPVVVVYQRKTPITEQVDPQPLSLAEGENEIGADCDYIDTIKLDCEYAATPGG